MLNKAYAISALAFSLMASAATARELTMVADEWCPFNCKADEKQNPGFFIELAQIVFQGSPHTVTYLTEPWARAKKDVDEGTYDILVGGNNIEAPTLLFPQTGGVRCDAGLFSLPEKSFHYKSTADLKTRRIGVIDEYSYGDELDTYIKENRRSLEYVQVLPGDDALERNIKKLQNDRIDVLVETPAVLHYRMKQMGISQTVTNNGFPSKTEQICEVGFTPKAPDSPEIQKFWDKRINELKQDGTYKRLTQKYSME